MPQALNRAALVGVWLLAVPWAASAANTAVASLRDAAAPRSTATTVVEGKLIEFAGSQRVAQAREAYAEIPWPTDDGGSQWPSYGGELRVEAWRLLAATPPVLAWRRVQRQLEAGGFRIVGRCAGIDACWNGAELARYFSNVYSRRRMQPLTGWPDRLGAIASLGDTHMLRAERGAVGERQFVVVSLGLGSADHEVRDVRGQPLAVVAWLDERAAGLGSSVLDPEELRARLDRDGRVILRALRFDGDAPAADGDTRAQLDAIARWLAEDRKRALNVVGHGERSGPGVDGETASAARAQAIVAALVARGVEPDRLTPRGLGALAPLAADDPPGRAANRRIELVVR